MKLNNTHEICYKISHKRFSQYFVQCKKTLCLAYVQEMQQK